MKPLRSLAILIDESCGKKGKVDGFGGDCADGTDRLFGLVNFFVGGRFLLEAGLGVFVFIQASSISG
jgi:hypothetical protein